MTDTNTPQSRPREWWIREYHTGIHNGNEPIMDMTPKFQLVKEGTLGAIRVIEYSAYEKLEAKLKEHEADCLLQHAADDQRQEELAAENKKLRKEYDDYIDGKPGSWYIVELKKERDALQEENARLKAELDRLKK